MDVPFSNKFLMPCCVGCSTDDDYDDFQKENYFIFKAHFENFLEFLDSRTPEVNSKTPRWLSNETSLNVLRIFVTAIFFQFFQRCGKGEQMRCRLILLISEHPIQQGIRKGGGPDFWLRTERTRTEWRILGSWIGQPFLIPASLDTKVGGDSWRSSESFVYESDDDKRTNLSPGSRERITGNPDDSTEEIRENAGHLKLLFKS